MHQGRDRVERLPGGVAEVEPDLNPEIGRMLEQLRGATDRAERVRLLKELIQRDGYLSDEVLEVTFARLLARLVEAD